MLPKALLDLPKEIWSSLRRYDRQIASLAAIIGTLIAIFGFFGIDHVRLSHDSESAAPSASDTKPKTPFANVSEIPLEPPDSIAPPLAVDLRALRSDENRNFSLAPRLTLPDEWKPPDIAQAKRGWFDPERSPLVEENSVVSPTLQEAQATPEAKLVANWSESVKRSFASLPRKIDVCSNQGFILLDRARPGLFEPLTAKVNSEFIRSLPHEVTSSCRITGIIFFNKDHRSGGTIQFEVRKD
ncbi:MAG: hypothetical protein AAFU82_04790 [Pseudomonadota bacterium]